MYIITDKDDKIMCISNTLNYQKNGNLLVQNDNYAIPPILVKKVYENVEVPEKVVEDKYCYTEEQGFYRNPNWKETFTTEQRISALEDTVNMLLGFEEETI